MIFPFYGPFWTDGAFYDSKMVIINLCGGLGNQLWQRAFGYVLEALGNEVAFDPFYFANNDERAYVLYHWNCEVPLKGKLGQVIQEPDLRYHPEFLKKYNEDVTLTGYWQCPRYLEGIEDQIRKAFVPRTISKETAKLIQTTEQCNSVSFHVRRTDTLSSRGLVNHGLVPQQFYDRARNHVSNCHYFIFSDDIEWCKKNLSFECTFVDHNTTGVQETSEHEVRKTNDGTEYEDLWIMSRCKHNIIANSSFGFWGAWLNQNPDKIVIYPRQWFAPTSPHDSTDMFPKTWISC